MSVTTSAGSATSSEGFPCSLALAACSRGLCASGVASSPPSRAGPECQASPAHRGGGDGSRRRKPGDSVAVAGCCLTVTAVESGPSLEFEAVPETVARTNLGRLERRGGGQSRAGAACRRAARRAFRPGPRRRHRPRRSCGAGRRRRAPAARRSSPELLRYCVEKGSLDGRRRRRSRSPRSTTTASRSRSSRSPSEHTTLGGLVPGDEVNVEVDLLAKYAERLASS